MSKSKQPKEHGRCSISVIVTDKTGQKRELPAEEVEERLRKVLSIPLEERMKMSLRRAGYEA